MFCEKSVDKRKKQYDNSTLECKDRLRMNGLLYKRLLHIHPRSSLFLCLLLPADRLVLHVLIFLTFKMLR